MLTDRPPRICLAPGCGAIGPWERGYCPTHSKAESRRRSQGGYNAAWDRFRAKLLADNPICQRVRAGVRCTAPSVVAHHIIPYETRLDLAHDQRNVVGVCRACHPKPGDSDQGAFAPTLWREPMSGEPLAEPVAVPARLWSLAERLTVLGK